MEMEKAIEKLIDKIEKDYIEYIESFIISNSAKAKHANKKRLKVLSEWNNDLINKSKNFKKNITISKNKKYTKISTQDDVWGFIVNNDGEKFEKGDILKPKGWSAPNTNAARGNIFSDDYSVSWTGPHYLK